MNDPVDCPEMREESAILSQVIDYKDFMAEGEGFEPPVPFRAQRFSRPPVSTAHPSLRGGKHPMFVSLLHLFSIAPRKPCLNHNGDSIDVSPQVIERVKAQ